MAAPGERLPDLWAPGPRGARAAGVGTVVAIGLHGLLALGFATIDPSRFRAEKPIEIDVEEKLPPPEVKPPPPPAPKPPPPEPKPRIVHRLPTTAPPPDAAAPERGTGEDGRSAAELRRVAERDHRGRFVRRGAGRQAR